LELSPEQHDKVERIIRESQQRTKSLWEPIAAKLNDELRKTSDRIRQVLTSEQRQKFDEMRSRAREVRPDKLMKRPLGGPTSSVAPPEGFRRQFPTDNGPMRRPPVDKLASPEALPPGPPTEPVPPPDRPQ